MTLLEFAKSYTEKMGWSVIPCVNRGKASLVPWKQYQQRIADPGEISEWFDPGNHSLNFSQQLAIITGDVSRRLLVIDFDRFDLFVEWFHVTRLRTLAVRTGKGVHLYCRLADGEKALTNRKFYVNGLLAGDIRYNGGYVIAPPSVHSTGRVYQWSRAPLRTVTLEALQLEFRTPDAPPSNVRHQGLKRPARPDYPKQNSGEIRNVQRYAAGALSGEIERICRTGQGARNDQLYRSALKLSKYAEVLGERNLELELTTAGTSAGLSLAEANKTVKSGLKNGMEHGVLKAA